MHFSRPLAVLAATLALPLAASAQTDLMQVEGVRAGDTLNVRTGPGGAYEDIGDLQPGARIAVLGYDASGRWAAINYAGQIAYVSARYLAPAAPQGAPNLAGGTGAHSVTGIPPGDADGGLVVRGGAGTDFARIGVLPNGMDVHVIQRSPNGRWAMIAYGSGVGWVGSAYLTAAPPIPQPRPTPTPQTAPDGGPLPAVFFVTGVAADDRLNFRDAPRASGGLIGSFAPGDTLEVLGMATGNWAYVTDGEVAGYVNSRFLTRGGGAITTANGFPLGLKCLGTEPFWNFDIAEDRTVTFTQMVSGQAPLTSLVQTTPSGSTGSYPYTFSAPPYSGVIATQFCSDGMSDNSYPISIVLNAPGQSGGIVTQYGCCNLVP